MAEVSNTDDVADVRDVITRFEELETERADLVLALQDVEKNLSIQPDDTNNATVAELEESIASAKQDLAEWDEINGDELKVLRELLDDMKGSGGDHEWRGDWYPVSLIRDSYFEDYAEELADDIGAIDRNARWPVNCIDWKEAARQLQADYSTVEWDGVTYWYR